jgi:predicted nucleic acid-binding Zn ribbon protein
MALKIPMNKIQKQCAVCGQPFVPKTVDSVYCSKTCGNAAYREKKRQKRIPAINLGARLVRIDRAAIEEMFPVRQTPLKKEKPTTKFYSLEPQDCYTIGEIAKKFGISDSTVYKHIRKYSIPTRQIGNYVYAPNPEDEQPLKKVKKKKKGRRIG